MRRILLFILMIFTAGLLRGQNQIYDFTKGNLSITDWRSVMGYINSRNYTIPNADSLSSDGLILKSSREHPTFLEVATDMVILPGWEGDILESHQPYHVKYGKSKIKLMLKGSDGDILASETAQVNSPEPGSANLINVRCTDPKGCYLEVIMWSHDSLESINLNRLKKIEIRSKSPVTVYDFSEHDPSVWETNFGEITTPNQKLEGRNAFYLRSYPGNISSFKWTSNRIFGYGWRGDIHETHSAENIFWAGNIYMSLRGYSTHEIMAQAQSISGGKPLGKADLINVECNDPLGCYLEVELSSGDGAIKGMNELKSIQMQQSQNLDQYDIGVFYMPFWHNDWGVPYWSSEQTKHRWNIVDKYNQEMVRNGLSSYELKPLNIYSSPASPPNYYNEEDQSINEQQLSLMKEYGIDYVIYDSYFQYYKQNLADTVYNPKKWAPFWNEVVKNVSQLKRPAIPFSIMWASDFTSNVFDPKNPASKANPRGCRGFFETDGGLDRLVNHWDTLLSNPNYKKINNKPVVYIYYSGTSDPSLGGFTNSLEGLCGYCADDPFFDPMGQGRYESNLHSRKTAYVLSKIKEKLKRDIFFVAVVSAATAWQGPLEKQDWYLNYPVNGGFDAITSYGLSAFDGADLFVNTKWWDWDWSYDYERMIGAYFKYYDFLLNQNNSTLTSTNLKFHVPVTAGFNRGSLNLHENRGTLENGYAVNIWDQAISTPASFEVALKTAKEQIIKHPNQTGRNVVICCWNEYAEGTVIEPTTQWGYSYLEKVEQIFSDESIADEVEDVHLKIVDQSKDPYVESEETRKKENETSAVKLLVTNYETPDLFKVYPNPVERSANISFRVDSPGTASVQILNAMGQVVQELFNQSVESGSYELVWDASSKPKGFYFCRIMTDDYVEVKKLILTH